MNKNNIYPDNIDGPRALRCVADGRVAPLCELKDSIHSRRMRGDGYAVYAGTAMSRISEYFGGEVCIDVSAPTDGVVTSHENGLTLRTGDGVSVSVILGDVEVDFIPDVGEKLRSGDVICTLPANTLSDNGIGGAVVVLFNETDRITELHISSGRKKTGERAAFYRIICNDPR